MVRMKRKLSNQFMINYLIVFLLSIVAAVFAFLLLSFADSVISQTLMKNTYTADMLMREDYREIDTASVVENGGGVQIINGQYEVVYSAGIDTLRTTKLTAGEFTDFLMRSKARDVSYHYDIRYNEEGDFWLVVTFPTSLRLDFSLTYNKEAASRDFKNVAGVFIAVILFYLLLLAAFAAIFSRITSARITNPLRKLCEGTRLLREGDYSARVDLRLNNEFAQLQDTFNDMAQRIETETSLRKQSEEERKKLILDISHDLKNPLASVAGYAELCLKKSEHLEEEYRGYLQVIHKNSQRASRLLTELFELSRLENPAFTLKRYRTEVCEYLRQVCGELLPALEQAGFVYEFDIPDGAVYAMLDSGQMSRVFHNLSDNAVRYNPSGTRVMVSLSIEAEDIVILFKDNGVGIPAEMAENIFGAFVRVDDSRNSGTGGSGLGLSIAQRIVQAHGGSLALRTDTGQGCTFRITLPKI